VTKNKTFWLLFEDKLLSDIGKLSIPTSTGIIIKLKQYLKYARFILAKQLVIYKYSKHFEYVGIIKY